MTSTAPRASGSRGETRSDILGLLKRTGSVNIETVADGLGISHEAARQHLVALQAEGWLRREQPAADGRAGRPAARFVLTEAGDHLFAKHYDGLAVELIDAVGEQLGPDGLADLLAGVVDRQVARWAPQLSEHSLEERLTALKEIYTADDPYTAADRDARGPLLVERNCPYLNVALERPALCSVTVATLTRLLGYRVVREARFQDGDRRCVFRVRTDQPVDPSDYRFAFEDDPHADSD